MDPTINFHGSNSGLQLGINSGTINTNEFHSSFNLDEELPSVNGAAFDSYDSQHEERCLPGTRTDVLCQIQEWALSPQGKCIFWLNGMAGTGKSTISRTVAESFSEAKSLKLGASFFFKRGEADRGNAKRLFSTIARQLMTSIPQLLPYIRQAVIDNSPAGIMGKGLKEQFDKLLLQPLLSLSKSDLPVHTVMIVIDALDECEGDNDIRLILRLLLQLQKQDFRVRVFLTSRPELPIRLGFSEIAFQDLILHEISEDVITQDISLFLHHRLSTIRSECYLPEDWPGNENLERLVALSIPLFIFAATICRIFEDPNWDPIDSLTEILAQRHDQSNMDRTYLPVLDRLLLGQTERQKKQLVDEFQQVVGSIVILKSSLSVLSLSKLLNLPERLIQLRLKPLFSVLKVPTDRSLPVRLFHLSFRDFLLSPETRDKTPFSVDEKVAHYNLTLRCFLVCQTLRKNICELPSDGTPRTEIDRATIDHCIPPELQYSCRYWAHHMVKCEDIDKAMNEALFHFFQRHFLHWMEVMSLLGLTLEIIEALNLVQTAALGNQSHVTPGYLQDMKRFILRNLQIASRVPLQIYSSGLIFAPEGSITRINHKGELPSWIFRLPKTEKNWNAGIQALEGHSGGARSIAFSPDGRMLASAYGWTVQLWDPSTGAQQQTIEWHSEGSHRLSLVQCLVFSPDCRLLASGYSNNMIQLWDPVTGTLQQTLSGHSDSVESVAFSTDGRLLASASHDHTVRLWDPVTGMLQHTLKGHSYDVSSVVFSPDSRLLVSASDNTVKLWDPVTGILQDTLTGHLGYVKSVAFSPDSRLLASASGDIVQLWNIDTCILQQTFEDLPVLMISVAFSPDGRLLAIIATLGGSTVLLWDLTTNTLQQILEGHSDMVDSVAFSSDGRLLATASRDETVWLWDLAIDTQQLLQSPESPLNQVTSVTFSPDGQVLASGSADYTVRLWDPATGTLQQSFQGHLDSITSVAFSPSGQVLASASWDSTIRIWDLVTGELHQVLEGHSHSVGTIAFSPNDQLPVLASASYDRTVRLWDPVTGMLQYILEGHFGVVKSVAFSPDGRFLASASYDCTVRLWHLLTGALEQTLKGHPSSVYLVTFSPDNRRLASASVDGIVSLWDLATGSELQRLEIQGLDDYLRSPVDGFCVMTNLGLFDIQSDGSHHASRIPYKREEIFIEQACANWTGIQHLRKLYGNFVVVIYNGNNLRTLVWKYPETVQWTRETIKQLRASKGSIRRRGCH